jgi:DNA-binding NtrC family response regulator
LGRLVVVRSADATLSGEPIELPTRGFFLVGRTVERDGLSLSDHSLSRLHFRIGWDGRQGAFRIGDAGSRNGTYVNGRRTASAALQPGDVIRAGDSLFVYEEREPMKELWFHAERAAKSGLNVLLLGETGSGKEVVARFLHRQSGREGEFLAVNCAAIPKELLASELFGHARGSFSGAFRARAGLFVQAGRGTLLLDEVAELPVDVQAVLLRVLQERTVRPVGEERELTVHAGVLAATHVELDRACEAGSFRSDLFARLAQIVIRVPPLRERRSEILSLARGFGPRPLRLSASAAEAMLLWSWPRNVRELKTIIEGFVAIHGAEAALELDYLERVEPKMVAPFEAPQLEAAGSGSPRVLSVGREQLRELLVQRAGNISAVAKDLGKTRAQIYRWLKAYGLLGKAPDKQAGQRRS